MPTSSFHHWYDNVIISGLSFRSTNFQIINIISNVRLWSYQKHVQITRLTFGGEIIMRLIRTWFLFPCSSLRRAALSVASSICRIFENIFDAAWQSYLFWKLEPDTDEPNGVKEIEQPTYYVYVLRIILISLYHLHSSYVIRIIYTYMYSYEIYSSQWSYNRGRFGLVVHVGIIYGLILDLFELTPLMKFIIDTPIHNDVHK